MAVATASALAVELIPLDRIRAIRNLSLDPPRSRPDLARLSTET